MKGNRLVVLAVELHMRSALHPTCVATASTNKTNSILRERTIEETNAAISDMDISSTSF